MPSRPRYTSTADLFASPLAEKADGERARLRIQVLPEGVFEHPWYGILRWEPEVFAEMIRHFNEQSSGVIPMLNFDHSSQNPFAAEARAAGWFVDLEHEAGVGLFASVELNPCGEEAIRNREYRYISAEVADSWTTSDGKTFANVLLGAALTNSPFHNTMQGVFERPGETGMSFDRNASPFCFSSSGATRFCVALEAAALAAGNPHAREGDDLAPVVGVGGDTMTLLERIRSFFKLPETADEEAVVAALEAATPPDGSGSPVTMAAPPVESEKLSAMQAELMELRAAVVAAAARATDAEKARSTDAARDAVAAQLARGTITPAQKDAAEKLALESPELFAELFAGAAQVIDYRRAAALKPSSGGDETYDQAVVAYSRDHGVDYVAAARAVAQDRPELYARRRLN